MTETLLEEYPVQYSTVQHSIVQYYYRYDVSSSGSYTIPYRIIYISLLHIYFDIIYLHIHTHVKLSFCTYHCKDLQYTVLYCKRSHSLITSHPHIPGCSILTWHIIRLCSQHTTGTSHHEYKTYTVPSCESHHHSITISTTLLAKTIEVISTFTYTYTQTLNTTPYSPMRNSEPIHCIISYCNTSITHSTLAETHNSVGTWNFLLRLNHHVTLPTSYEAETLLASTHWCHTHTYQVTGL